MVRCVQCESEFTLESLEGAKACPKCGTKSVPMDTEKDVTVRINVHEIRILTIWASNWADQFCERTQQKTLAAIIQRLNAQLPGTPLTMRQEIGAIQEEFPSATLLGNDGKAIVPPKGEPS